MQVWLKPPGADDNIPGTAEDLLKLATGGVAQVFRYWDRKRGAPGDDGACVRERERRARGGRGARLQPSNLSK